MLDASLQQINNYLTTLHGKVDALAKRPSGGGGTATPQPVTYPVRYFYDRYLVDGCRFRVDGNAVLKPAKITAVEGGVVTVSQAAHGLADNDAVCVLVGNTHAFYGLVTNMSADSFAVANTTFPPSAAIVVGDAHAGGLMSFTAAAKPFQNFTVKIAPEFTVRSFDHWYGMNSRATTYIDMTFDQGKPFKPEDMIVPLALGRQAIDGMTAFSMGTTRSAVNGNLYTVRFNPMPPVGIPIYVNVRY